MMEFEKELKDMEQIKVYLEQAPKKIEFEHKGVLGEVKRMPIRNTYNGYLWLDAPEECAAHHIIDMYFHGGITYQEENEIGFHTGQSMDVIPYADPEDGNEFLFEPFDPLHKTTYEKTYKTAEFVKDILIGTIDTLDENGLLVDGHIIDVRDVIAVTHEHMVKLIKQSQDAPEGMQTGRYIADSGRGWLAARIEEEHEYGEFPNYDAALAFLTDRYKTNTLPRQEG